MPRRRADLTASRNTLGLTPSGRLRLVEGSDGIQLSSSVDEALKKAFQRSEAEGLFVLLQHRSAITGCPALTFGVEVVRDVLKALSLLPEASTDADGVRTTRPSSEMAVARAEAAPPLLGRERLAEELDAIYGRLAAFVADRLESSGGPLGATLAAIAGDWHARGRLWLHLAENTQDERRPLALLATFTPSGEGPTRHTPLAAALDMYRGQRDMLEALLAPLERAAHRSPWFRELLDSREVFHPLALSAEDARAFIQASEALEGTGVMVRLPKKWGRGPRPKPGVQVRIGDTGASLDLGALLSFDCRLALPDGSPLSSEEAAKLLEGVPRLELLRGQWVDVNPALLQETLSAWEAAAETVTTVGDGLRFVAGLETPTEEANAWSTVEAGTWLNGLLKRIRTPGYLDPSPNLRAQLRPYQQEGFAWLVTLFELGIGGCLADDMGLGKTVQVIALLLHLKDRDVSGPSLLVVPTSLLGNWAQEINRFAPGLRVLIAHRSEHPKKALEAALRKLDSYDVVLSTYGSFARMPLLIERNYPLVVLDEAQAIKNPSTTQARHARNLQARCRIALTGTPIENRLGDLWALFAFLNPGLLGGETDFAKLIQRLSPPKGKGFRPLRRLLSPYLLRRVKTDKRIIQDLPDKSEITTWCTLTRRQAALYSDAVNALKAALSTSEGKQRRGLVLGFLTRFKQICNHPSHWLQDERWDPAESGKISELLRLADTFRERQDKVLIFTQYREMTEPLHAILSEAFGAPGLVLHGATPPKKRASLVASFQDPDGPPFFVLSLKAGGTGLNLTAAAHVVHFDRWWNPAVENQATDRAYRIGQHRNVLVHRFVVRGTLEERIDALLESKRSLAQEVLSVDASTALTELSDKALLDMVKLDRASALAQETP